ncbi:hypothetical protein HS088_TW15G00669 [Tripterygium wilfordii]|uniref:RWP-RK domain-containing protein n=1 Tax=Tripterygium wilfordii TaxID=458696 RepID=A0A7J7CMB2_TRIWF|nr:hypothetical protein HS088_TW15G00669 [Tripterygium wilfordii]
MANPRENAPYNDSYVTDADFEYELINLLNTPDPNPGYLTSINQPNIPVPPPATRFGIGNADNNNNHPSNPMIWNSYNGSNHGTQLAIPEQSITNGGKSLLARNPGYRNAVPLPKWPREPEPYHCACCQVLRELIHTDGTFVTKLEIHVPIDRCFDKMISFSKKSPADVKQFMLQYISDRNKGGFTKVHDPMTLFYETLCVELDIEDGLDVDDFINTSPSINSGVGQAEQAERRNASTSRVPKSTLAAQRERAKKMKLKDLKDVFHLPINKASAKVDLCPTVVKKICRREGLTRWPHRKIKSIEKQIENYKPLLASMHAEERVGAEQEILKLEQEVADIMAGADT